MFPTGSTKQQVVKVSVGDEVRRLRVDLPEGSSAASALAAIRSAVKQAFKISDDGVDTLVLKYTDDEGDLCTLIDPTMEDFVELAAGGLWRLQASVGKPLARPTQVAQVLQAERAKDPAAEPAAAAEKEVSADADTTSAEWSGGSAVNMFHKLPFITMWAGSDWGRSMLNHVGTEKREELVLVCCDILEHLDLVAEAVPLRPRLEAYINGNDTEHFGDMLAALLTAWATSASPENVQMSLDLHGKRLKGVMKQIWGDKGKGKGKGLGKGKGKFGKGMCKGIRMGMLASMLAKGMGKGADFSMTSPSSPPTAAPDCTATDKEATSHPQAAEAEWEQDPLGALFAQQLLHTGGHSHKGHGMWPGMQGIGGMDMLAGLLTKGLGKGKGKAHAGAAPMSTAAHPQGAPVAPMEATLAEAKAQEVVPPTVAAPPTAPVSDEAFAKVAAEGMDLDSKAQDLMGMGLVQDLEVARELLVIQDGDVSKVVAMLTG